MTALIRLRIAEREYRVEVGDGGIFVDGEQVDVPSRALAVAQGGTRWVFLDGEVYELDARAVTAPRATHQGELSAPMPATVRRIHVKAGAAVEKGAMLLVLEAMKMELPLRAPAAGTVTAIHCREGELVQPGTILVELA